MLFSNPDPGLLVHDHQSKDGPDAVGHRSNYEDIPVILFSGTLPEVFIDWSLEIDYDSATIRRVLCG
jgi:hypothetical protein